MSEKSFRENLTAMGLKRVLSFLDANPEGNIPRLIEWVERFNPEGVMTVRLQAVRNGLANPKGNWYQLTKSFWTDIDDDVRRKLFENFVINATAVGSARQKKLREEHQCNIPWAFLIDPTSACNLRCKGCWAAEYGHQLSMDYELLDDIIRQGKKLGVFFYLYSGGEPLMRKDDILRLCRKHSDCVFMAFTNATLIDDAFADALLEVKNFVPAISVEGFAAETDERRGVGSYAIMMDAMKILKERKLPFGFSTCYTRQNVDVVASEDYFDEMIARGCKFGWFFTYIPVGEGAVRELMVTDGQREYMYHQIREFRKTKPLFTMDFWNDAEFVGGCIAGGRRYLHINANGDIEPCAFIHYADSNVREKTIIEALKAPLFKEFHQQQPFNQNHLRPCPLLDNPDSLVQVVASSGAYSTEILHEEPVLQLCSKCYETAKRWGVTADRLWEKTHGEESHPRSATGEA